MAYVNYEYYKSLYETPAISETEFNRYAFDACRKIDIATTGVDNIKKLKVAFPVDEDDAEAVKRCVVAVIDLMDLIKKAEDAASSAKGYIERADGTIQGKVITSVTAGNESISFSSAGSSGSATLIDKALADKSVQRQMYKDIITEYLSGVSDANGVNLLYMGKYPYLVR